MARAPRLAPFVIYLTPESKSVYMRAASLSFKSLSQHVRDLLTCDVTMRAEEGEPHFAGLRDELAKSQAQTPHGQGAYNKRVDQLSTIKSPHSCCGCSCGCSCEVCQDGHGSSHHTEACQTRILSEESQA